MPKKSTQTTIQQRLTEIQKFLFQGYTRAEIVQNGSKKWGVSDRQIDDYIQMVTDEWQKESISDRSRSRIAHIQTRKHLYRKMYQKEDYRACILVLKDVAELEGLYEKIQTEPDEFDTINPQEMADNIVNMLIENPMLLEQAIQQKPELIKRFKEF